MGSGGPAPWGGARISFSISVSAPFSGKPNDVDLRERVTVEDRYIGGIR